MFRLIDIKAGYDGKLVLSGVTLDIPEGVFVLVGPSGSGKSTLLRLLNRMLDPSDGEILFRGKPLVEYPIRQLRRRVGMVFQKPILFSGTVADNLRFAESSLSDDEISALLVRVGLPGDYLSKMHDQLSVGEAQRVCLARTLATKPEVLLLDEPTSALDPTAVRTIEELIAGLASSVSVIWVTHIVEQVLRLGGNAAMLYRGKIRWKGKSVNIRSADDPIVRKFVEGELNESG